MIRQLPYGQNSTLGPLRNNNHAYPLLIWKNISPTLQKFSPRPRLLRNLQTSHFILDVKRGHFEHIGKSFLLHHARHGKSEINLLSSLSFILALSRKRPARHRISRDSMPGCKHWCEYIFSFFQERYLLATSKYEGEVLSVADPTLRYHSKWLLGPISFHSRDRSTFIDLNST